MAKCNSLSRYFSPGRLTWPKTIFFRKSANNVDSGPKCSRKHQELTSKSSKRLDSRMKYLIESFDSIEIDHCNSPIFILHMNHALNKCVICVHHRSHRCLNQQIFIPSINFCLRRILNNEHKRLISIFFFFCFVRYRAARFMIHMHGSINVLFKFFFSCAIGSNLGRGSCSPFEMRPKKNYYLIENASWKIWYLSSQTIMNERLRYRDKIKNTKESKNSQWYCARFSHICLPLEEPWKKKIRGKCDIWERCGIERYWLITNKMLTPHYNRWKILLLSFAFRSCFHQRSWIIAKRASTNSTKKKKNKSKMERSSQFCSCWK